MPFRSKRSKRESTQPITAPNDLNDDIDTPREGMFANIVDDCQAAFVEFCGTVTFLTLAYGGVQASGYEANAQGLPGLAVDRVMYISLSFGLSLLVSAWLFFRVTGGLFNPNVSLALVIAGVITPVRFVLYCIAQLIGGIVAAALVLALTPGVLQSNTTLIQGINRAQGVFIEAFITAALCLAVLMLAAEKHNATPFAPVGIGLTVLVCHLFAVNYTGAGMNTARSFGPAVVTGFPYNSHWIYWVGPFLGSLFASGFYAILKHYRYWKLNPTADVTDVYFSPPDPVAKVAAVRSLSKSSRARTSIGDGRSGVAAALSGSAVDDRPGPMIDEKRTEHDVVDAPVGHTRRRRSSVATSSLAGDKRSSYAGGNGLERVSTRPGTSHETARRQSVSADFRPKISNDSPV